MGFKEELQKLGLQINERRTHITNEEMAKQALIIPFLQVLGYDVFNPLEIQPEYYADFGGRKGEKVDYALFKDGKPIIFIEAKTVDEDLINFDPQLSRYFNATPEVRLGIITNGIEYRLFTDLKLENVMDDTPFYTMNLTGLKDNDVETLQHLRKEAYTNENLSRIAEELAYTNAINEMMKGQFTNPTDDFVRLMMREVEVPKITAKGIERFRPIVKKALSNAVMDIVSLGLVQQEQGQPSISEMPVNGVQEQVEPVTDGGMTLPPETTDEEKRGYEIIRVLLQKASRDIQGLNCKDTYSYFSVNHQSIRKWFIRFMFAAENKHLILRLNPDLVASMAEGFKSEPAPKGWGVSRVFINNVDDLVKLEKLIIACYDDVATKN